MNVKLLRKVKKHIEEIPSRWSWEWAQYSRKAPCGTAACIGGWCSLLGLKPPEGTKDVVAWAEGVPTDKVADLLRIDGQSAHRLFFSWPPGFNIHSAKDAARRIEHFIKTKGKE